MKKINLLFAICLVPLALQAAVADDAIDIVRSAKRNSAVNVVTSSRQKSDVSQLSSTLTQSRQAVASQKTTDINSRDRTISPRDSIGVVSTASSRSAIQSQSVAARTAVSPARSTATASPRVLDRNIRKVSATTSARTAMRPASVGRAAINTTTTRTASTPQRNISGAASRAAVATNIVQSGETAQNYKKCREVYYACMDEFCANKDTQLKRCACSVRVNDFDGVKKKLSNVEDKMLDFNQRLLTVNMDKEDAEAISKATDGELAYQQDDKSTSKQILDEISKKLKSNTSNNDLTRNLSTISLSLDMDSAFDNIDSMMGASTTTKAGTALYSAALPICREMAAEVCDEDGAAIAESGYQMAIEQDCTIVSKAYETKQGQALEKIREGGALLEISRLDIHQKRNADDILTCKKKMLDMLSNSSVCGTGLGKCLDTTGRYIDPSTGEAFLTVNLIGLGSLITRPSGDQKWTATSGNDKFVSFLNSKKKYLEPAMEGCQDISDRVWADFVEDALAQIKLAQEQKLEDMRQSCTSLTTQCLSNTAKSISEFDARALSIFGVSADKTVNEMCANIKTACTALLESTSGDADWVGGMTEIATDKTYETIIQTCREVGKACIVQACKSISGNFGLCENIDLSVNRKSIINRTACWNNVVQCVADAGRDPIDLIMSKLNKTPRQNDGNFYKENYSHITTGPITRTNGNNVICTPTVTDANGTVTQKDNCVYDICEKCGDPGYSDCATCRLAEKIWGNCEFIPNRPLTDATSQNMIKITTGAGFDTLLSWFAVNTGTSTNKASCKDTSCGIGMTLVPDPVTQVPTCVPTDSTSNDGKKCAVDQQIVISTTPGKWTNCCDSAQKDSFYNCCDEKTQKIQGVKAGATSNYYNSNYPISGKDETMLLCLPKKDSQASFVAGFTGGGEYKSGMNYLICVDGTLSYENTDAANFPGGQTVKCSGKFVVINNDTGTYTSPVFIIKPDAVSAFTDPFYPSNSYNISQAQCLLDPTKPDKMWGSPQDGTWAHNENCKAISGYPTNKDNNLMISYDNPLE